MKVLLYFENEKLLQESGIGRALRHQMMALESAGVAYTINPLEDYDILHINTYFLNSNAIIAECKKKGKAVIYHAHSTEEDFRNSFLFSNEISPLFKKYLISLYSQGDEIITPTPYSKKILESYGITVPINAISNGIDLKRFAYDKDKVEAYRRYFSLNKKDKVVIGVGLYFERKGILDFLEIAKKLPEYTFIWFGYSSPLTIPLEVSAAIENRSKNVIMPGYVKGAIIEGAYLDADCFFFPSYEETEGIVVLEALASRQKVVVRDIGAFDPWLIDGYNCFKANDNRNFIKLIEDCVENRCIDTSENAYKTAEERSIENIGLKLKEVYERVYKKVNYEKESL